MDSILLEVAGLPVLMAADPSTTRRYLPYRSQRARPANPVEFRVFPAEAAAPATSTARRDDAWMVVEDDTVSVGGSPWPAEIDRLLLHGFAAIFARRANGVVAHAAAVAGEAGAVAFLGPSGAGKTTAARNCPCALIHPDRVALGVGPEGPWLAPLPFLYAEPREGGVSRRPVAILAMVAQAKTNRVEPLSHQDAFRGLLGSVLLPANPADAQRVVDTVAALVAAVEIVTLEATLDGGFWPLLAARNSNCAAGGGSVG